MKFERNTKENLKNVRNNSTENIIILIIKIRINFVSKLYFDDCLSKKVLFGAYYKYKLIDR